MRNDICDLFSEQTTPMVMDMFLQLNKAAIGHTTERNLPKRRSAAFRYLLEMLATSNTLDECCLRPTAMYIESRSGNLYRLALDELWQYIKTISPANMTRSDVACTDFMMALMKRIAHKSFEERAILQNPNTEEFAKLIRSQIRSEMITIYVPERVSLLTPGGVSVGAVGAGAAGAGAAGAGGVGTAGAVGTGVVDSGGAGVGVVDLKQSEKKYTKDMVSEVKVESAKRPDENRSTYSTDHNVSTNTKRQNLLRRIKNAKVSSVSHEIENTFSQGKKPYRVDKTIHSEMREGGTGEVVEDFG